VSRGCSRGRGAVKELVRSDGFCVVGKMKGRGAGDLMGVGAG